LPRYRLAAVVLSSALLAGVTFSSQSKAAFETGTLIVFVPTKDGLVIAADSRSNISLNGAAPDTQCDDAVKIIALRHHGRTVVAVGGTDRSFYIQNAQRVDEPCAYLKTIRPVLDSTQLASAYLESRGGQITKDMFGSLGAYFLKEIWAVQDRYPALLRSNAEDAGFATVGIGEYVPKSNLSIIAKLKVCIPKNQRAIICEQTWKEYRLTDERRIEAIGDGLFLLQYVLNGAGKQMLGGRHLDDYNYFLQNHQIISTATSDSGRNAAVDLIQSATIQSDRIGSRTIGGPIHVVLLEGRSPKPHEFN
jgi:hypothetical protein